MHNALTAGLFLVVFSVSVFAENNRNNQEELTGIQSQIKQLMSSIGLLSKKKSTLQAQLSKIEKQYGQTARTVKLLDRQLFEAQEELDQIRGNTSLQQQTIAEHRSGLEEQFRAAYAMGQREKLKLLLNQQDPALSSRMMVYYRYFNGARVQRLDEINRHLKQLNLLEQQNLNKSKHLASLKKTKKEEQQALEQTRNERKQLLQKIEKKTQSTQNRLLQLKADEKQLIKLLGSIQRDRKNLSQYRAANKPFDKLRGALPWPIQGKLLKKFGSRRAESRWDGVLIGAKEGAEIRAVNAGKVVFADWLRGYGLLVILDHGKGFMTLYAFNQSLYKEVGETVRAGDLIAAVGQSGGRSQSGLYFGIRKDGKPLDPSKWCKRTQKGRTG